MDQPLWQNLLNIAFIGLVVRRAAVGLALRAGGDLRLTLMYGVLCLAGLIAGITIWSSPRWVAGGLVTLLLAYLATMMVEIGLGVVPLAWALAGALLIGGLGALLVVLAWRAPHKSSPSRPY